MHIEIRERFRPYSHISGAAFLLPGTLWVVRASPTRLRIEDLSGALYHEEALEISLDLHNGFTLQQDLERQSIFVFGRSGRHFFRLELKALPTGIEFRCKEKSWVIALPGGCGEKISERLSLGNHKAQDVDLMRRRADLKEMLPLLFHLGQQIPSGPGGNVLAPSTLEELCLESFPPQIPSVELLSSGVQMIRSLFVKEQENGLELLPALPNLFDSGRLIGVQWGKIGKVDFEWTKRQMRRLVLSVQEGGVQTLCFPKQIQQYRLRSSLAAEGKLWGNRQPIVLAAGNRYLFDKFQK